jgi:hypothetical protein
VGWPVCVCVCVCRGGVGGCSVFRSFASSRTHEPTQNKNQTKTARGPPPGRRRERAAPAAPPRAPAPRHVSRYGACRRRWRLAVAGGVGGVSTSVGVLVVGGSTPPASLPLPLGLFGDVWVVVCGLCGRPHAPWCLHLLYPIDQSDQSIRSMDRPTRTASRRHPSNQSSMCPPAPPPNRAAADRDGDCAARRPGPARTVSD